MNCNWLPFPAPWGQMVTSVGIPWLVACTEFSIPCPCPDVAAIGSYFTAILCYDGYAELQV